MHLSRSRCQFHPQNYLKGCDPCIKKNLQNGEIPSCFFRLISDVLSSLKEFTLESFVKFYPETKKEH
ncbi:DUF6485 family protein [Bacillota bacterium LX-D]|nr:DUF6485 family protein [Bacillota bacterium LX-D]